MGQKLGLICSVMSKAPLLLLDEPMSGLDPLARIQLKELLHTYKKAGNSIFFSSHILADMDEMCDRIAVLHEGTIRFHGTPQSYKEQHQSHSLEQAFLHEITTHA